MNKAAIYTRVSTDEQDASLQIQAERCREYCNFARLDPASVTFTETAVSGGVPLIERPTGRLVAELIGDGSVQHVVVLKVDRLFRNVADALATVEDWNRRGVALHVVDLGGQAINTSTAGGWMCFVQLCVMAEFERRLMSERTKAGLQHRKENGKVYTGSPPYGWDHVDGHRVENEIEQQVIKLIKGDHADGATLQRIADRLNDLNQRTKRGGQWSPKQVSRVLKREAK